MNKKKDDDAQLFIVAGVIITIMIVVASISTINMSSVTKPIDKSGFIKSENRFCSDIVLILSEIISI